MFLNEEYQFYFSGSVAPGLLSRQGANRSKLSGGQGFSKQAATSPTYLYRADLFC